MLTWRALRAYSRRAHHSTAGTGGNIAAENRRIGDVTAAIARSTKMSQRDNGENNGALNVGEIIALAAWQRSMRSHATFFCIRVATSAAA